MMKKEKKKYIVIEKETHDYGDGNIQVYEKKHLTYAISEAKAINNIKYRLGINSYNCFQEWRGDGGRMITFYIKEEVN